MQSVIIETDRLLLREMSLSDMEALSSILQDENVMYAYNGAFSDEETLAWMQKQLQRYREHGFGLWGVFLKDTGEMIGQCGITMQEYKGGQIPEIGYLLAHKYWHKGYATEAATACREYGFDVLHFNALYSIIRDTNTASQNVALRNGMTLTDTIVKHYRGVDMPHRVFRVRKDDAKPKVSDTGTNKNIKEMEMQPNPDTIFPVRGCDTVTYVKPTVKNPNIIVGDFTYFSDTDFERHVLHHYDFIGDRLVIGKFCQIASGVTFIMNGANHQMNAASTYPFYIMEGWTGTPPAADDLPLRGDTIVGNDVWIGQDATILPGVHIGDGAIIGLGSIVGHDVEPYTIVAGNPARIIRKRFDDELIGLLQRLQWWDRSIGEIQRLIPLLTDSDLTRVKKNIIGILEQNG